VLTARMASYYRSRWTTLAPAFDATTDACCNHKVFLHQQKHTLNRLAIYKPGVQNTMTAGKSIQTPLFTDHRFQKKVATCI